MPIYYFDIRDGEHVAIDEEGTEFCTLAAVQEEAARTLAGMARDSIRSDGSGHSLAIEVRDGTGPLIQFKFTLVIERRKQ
jgi:hypothetical protein